MEIVYCKDCDFCRKSAAWKWCENNGVSPYQCAKGRGLNRAETVDLYDYCSSAMLKVKETKDETY